MLNTQENLFNLNFLIDYGDRYGHFKGTPKGSRTTATEENSLPTLIVTLTQTLTLTGGNCPDTTQKSYYDNSSQNT